jgi:uncharacterized protein (DUF362 family)
VDATARVVAVRGDDLAAMARELVEHLGGMSAIVRAGESVFIKPNVGGLSVIPGDSFANGESTKIEIVTAIAEECLKAGAARVTIGEGGLTRSFSWELATTLDHSTNLVREVERLNAAYPGRVELACLIADSPAWDPLPSPHTDLGQIFVSSLVTRADRVISIAPIKTHRWSVTTGTMKNFVGTTSFEQYGSGMSWRIGLHNAAGGVIQCFVDIVAALKPDLAIIDGSICCEGNGPHVYPGWWGTTVDVRDRLGSWFLLGGTDSVAVDATATRIIGQAVEQVPYLVRADEQGVGQTQADKIEMVGAALQELQMKWVPAEPTEGFSEVILPALIMWGLSGGR